MALRLKVGKRGCVILPKAVREALGIEEGDELLVEVGDSIILKPLKRKIDADKLREAMRMHLEDLKRVQGRREPEPGELAGAYLEKEFEDEGIH